MRTAVEVKSVSKRFGPIEAVKDITFSVFQGEIFAFLGINGAGKTTTLRMLAGTLSPDRGDIIIGGHSVVTEPLKSRIKKGYIPDRPYIYEKLSVREFLEFVGDLYSVPKTVLFQRIEELLAEYHLIERADFLIETLSHGMRQRLIIVSALLNSPEVLIVDEPMVGLDPQGAKNFKKKLKEYSENGMTIILSTHSLGVAEELADRIGIIHNGRILSIGTLDELREKTGQEKENLEEVFIALTSGETGDQSAQQLDELYEHSNY